MMYEKYTPVDQTYTYIKTIDLPQQSETMQTPDISLHDISSDLQSEITNNTKKIKELEYFIDEYYNLLKDEIEATNNISKLLSKEIDTTGHSADVFIDAIYLLFDRIDDHEKTFSIYLIISFIIDACLIAGLIALCLRVI